MLNLRRNSTSNHPLTSEVLWVTTAAPRHAAYLTDVLGTWCTQPLRPLLPPVEPLCSHTHCACRHHPCSACSCRPLSTSLSGLVLSVSDLPTNNTAVPAYHLVECFASWSRAPHPSHLLQSLSCMNSGKYPIRPHSLGR